jgi:hypothetical protein
LSASYWRSHPAYLAQQVTSRFFSTGGRDGWQPIDEVSAELAYAAGKEKYDNFRGTASRSTGPRIEAESGPRASLVTN